MPVINLLVGLSLLMPVPAHAGPMSDRLSRGTCNEHLASASDDVWIWANRHAKSVFGPELFQDQLQISDFSKHPELAQIERTFDVVDVLLHLAQQVDTQVGAFEPVQHLPWQLQYKREKGPGNPPGLNIAALGDRLAYDAESMSILAGEFVVAIHAHGPTAEATLDRVVTLLSVVDVPFDANQLRIVRSSVSPDLYIAIDHAGTPGERFVATLELLRALLHEVRQVPRSSWFTPLE